MVRHAAMLHATKVPLLPFLEEEAKKGVTARPASWEMAAHVRDIRDDRVKFTSKPTLTTIER